MPDLANEHRVCIFLDLASCPHVCAYLAQFSGYDVPAHPLLPDLFDMGMAEQKENLPPHSVPRVTFRTAEVDGMHVRHSRQIPDHRIAVLPTSSSFSSTVDGAATEPRIRDGFSFILFVFRYS